MLASFALSNERAHAAVEVQLSPSLSSPQPVGTTVTWTAAATDTNSGSLEYRFSVRPPAGVYAVVRDFAPSNSFEWTPSEREGTFDVRVAVRNSSTGELAQLAVSYSVSSRVTGNVPVLSSTAHPLVALYSAPACEAGSMRVRFWRAGDFSSQTTPWKSCLPGVSMNFYVAGMLPATAYSIRQEVSADPAAPPTNGPTLAFLTGALPSNLAPPPATVITPSAGDSGQDVLLLSYLNRSSPPFIGATNLSGALLWYYNRRVQYATRPCVGGTVLALLDSTTGRLDTLREIDLAGNTLRETNIKAVSDQVVALGGQPVTSFHHEARRLPDGRTLVLTGTERVLSDVQGPGPVAIVGDMIVVLDKDWQVVWRWDAFDHLDVTRKALLDEKCPQLCVTPSPTANDWTHANAVGYSPADGNLLLSVRHLDWIIKIDFRDGDGDGTVIWKLGKDGDFTFDSADPYPWFSHQHDADFVLGDTGTLALYDNGNLRQTAPEVTTRNSRGQVLNIDEAGRRVTFQLNANLGGYSSALGSALRLTNGNFHFLSGFLPDSSTRSIEARPDGSLAFVLRSQGLTYRSFRMRDLYTPGAAGGAEQIISFDAIAAQTYGGNTLDLSATASSALPVSFRVVSGPATLSGHTLTFTGAGTVVVQADQDGNIRYNPARSVRQTFAVNKANQIITFGTLANKTFGDADFAVSAAASSNLAVSYEAAGPCSFTAGLVHITGAGSCTVTASQAGDANFNAAASVQRSFAVSKAGSTTAVTVVDAVYDGLRHGGTATVTGAGGLNQSWPVAYEGRNATIYGPSSTAPTNAGDYRAFAGFGGDPNHTGSSDSKSFQITKAGQAITFGAVPNKTFGDPDFALSATASSGLAVGFTASGNCTVSGSTVHINGTGLCTLTASQPGDANRMAAADVTRSFNVTKASQTITFGALPNKTYGDGDFGVSASASSGLPVSFAAEGSCTVVSSAVHITGAGSCTVTASQAGDGNYGAATSVGRSFSISKAATATSLSSSSNPSGAGQGVTFTAAVTSTAGTPSGQVQFKVNGASAGDPIALNSGGVASLTTSALAAGSYTVMANYVGGPNFSASSGTLSGAQVVGGLFEFSLPLYTVGERAGSVTVSVRRTGDAGGAASVAYATDDGSVPPVSVPCASVTGLALGRCDYTGAAGRLNFAAGELEKTFVVLVNDDSFVEGTETTHLRLSNASAGTALGSRPSASLEITDDATESAGNPSDGDEAFVRQHYHDFLGREPDAAGLQFWAGGIKACGSDAGCREVKRVHTSAAFFLSIEFQNTGLFAYLMHKAASGDLAGRPVPLSFEDFIGDTRAIGLEVVVGQTGWEQRLDANKAAYALEFVRRPEFVARYPTLTSAAAFIDTLDANGGGVLTEAERSALISELSQNPADASLRASVLRKVAENARFAQAETARAFVLMQYFGYLRRDPDAAPNSNFNGYDFWLAKLNEFDGNFIAAEMVRAFINSDEYRQRFGH